MTRPHGFLSSIPGAALSPWEKGLLQRRIEADVGEAIADPFEHVLHDKGGVVYHAQAYGVTCDGVTDDAPALNALIQLVPAGSGTIVFPPNCVIRCESPIQIIDNVANGSRRGIRLLGSNTAPWGASLGCVLEYDGAGTDPFIQIYSRENVIENLVIRAATGRTLDALVDIDQEPGHTTTCTSNKLDRCRITGGGGATVTDGVRIAATAAANCEYMVFSECSLDTFVNACVNLADTTGQSKHNLFFKTILSTATYGILHVTGSFTTLACSFGSLDVAIQLAAVGDPITIIDSDEESCGRFLYTAGGSSGDYAVAIIGGRMPANGLHADGEFIHFRDGGPLVLEGIAFGQAAYVAAFKVSIGSAEPGSNLVVLGCKFPNDAPFDDTQRHIRRVLGCRGLDSGNNPVQLADEIHRYGNDIVGGRTTLDAASILGLIGDNQQAFRLKQLTELHTLAAAGTSDTAIQFPAGSLGLGASIRITTTITGCVTLDVGIAGDTTRFGTGLALTAGTTNAQTTTNHYAGATSVRFSAIGGGASFTAGVVRVTLYYYELEAPNG